jgi:hypothetical protein
MWPYCMGSSSSLNVVAVGSNHGLTYHVSNCKCSRLSFKFLKSELRCKSNKRSKHTPSPLMFIVHYNGAYIIVEIIHKMTSVRMRLHYALKI